MTYLKRVALAALPLVFCGALSAQARDLSASNALCTATVGVLNQQFTTIKSLDGQGNLPTDSGLIVHTVHGPGHSGTEMNLKQLNKLPVDTSKTCGDYMNATPPVFLPWCGSNRNAATGALSDASSWTYIRQDTLLNASAQPNTNEVVCEASNNKRYGLIFDNAYMNVADNLGCMYPLDGDTGNRTRQGCGISQNKGIPAEIIAQEGAGSCGAMQDPNAYLGVFNTLLGNVYQGQSIASIAGSLTCSLPKSKFDTWVKARQNINLSATTWPVNEFVLWNWDTYSTADLASSGTITGIYYLSGCAVASDGNRQDAQLIADLYKKWTNIDLPVVNLSNAGLRQKSGTPFSCN